MYNPKDDILNKYFQTAQGSSTKINITQGKLSPVSLPNNVSQRADCGADMESFTDKFKSLLDDTWEDGWGVFTVEAPTSNNPDEVEMPRIVFQVDQRRPSINKKGLKSRILEMSIDPDDNDYTLIMSRKWFDCDVSFLIVDKTNQQAQRLMTRLETFIDTYTGYFKQNGISEMIFVCEDNSSLKSKALEGIPSKCLRYLIVLERISVERVRTTKEIRSQIEANTPTTEE